MQPLFGFPEFRLRRFVVLNVALAGVTAGLTGCALTSVEPRSAASAALSGSVHGGQQPVSGATVQLIAPGTSGYGSAGTLLTSATTDVSGNFAFPAGLTCPPNSGLVYLLATGGNAGAGANPLIAEAAVVGPCSSLSSATFTNISEVTTVAAAYALAPFATVSATATSIGTSATNLQGLTNSFGAASNLASLATGYARKTSELTGIVPPTAELNTLADILSTCVNQGTSLGVSGSCAALFAAATPPGGVPPVNTFQAALDIAQNPGNNPGTLYKLVTANAPYQPTLTAAPTDFSVALGFNGGAITVGGGELGVAIDAAGQCLDHHRLSRQHRSLAHRDLARWYLYLRFNRRRLHRLWLVRACHPRRPGD